MVSSNLLLIFEGLTLSYFLLFFPTTGYALWQEPYLSVVFFITTEHYLIQLSSINICWVNEWAILSKTHIFQIRQLHPNSNILCSTSHSSDRARVNTQLHYFHIFGGKSFKKLIYFCYSGLTAGSRLL